MATAAKVPVPWASSRGKTASITFAVPTTFTDITVATAPASNRRASIGTDSPAATRTRSSPPNRSATVSAAACTPARSVTSHGTASMSVPATSASRSSRRAETATRAPRALSSRAVAAPIPLDAPTTQARTPCRLTLLVSSG